MSCYIAFAHADALYHLPVSNVGQCWLPDASKDGLEEGSWTGQSIARSVCVLGFMD